MWQVLLGTFLIINVLCGILFWSSLVLARESGHRIASYELSMTKITHN
jgi:hypothetical protein